MPILRRNSILRHRYVRIALLLFLFASVFEVSRIQWRLTRPQLTTLASADKPRKPERIYISSIHWNNERVLREYWVDAVVKLATALGPENVFVSVYESGSWDESKNALRLLDSQLGRLGVRRNVTLSEVTHLDEIKASDKSGAGWIETPRGRKELRRIPYLARLRNLTLKDLEELAKQGIHFDKVLFLNDVVFSTQDVMNLLNTNGGEYAAACSLDFSKPPLFYDTFALRDSEGHEHLMQTWPYFRSRKSRHALKMNMPVPVKSCWNGMVAVPAKPFTAQNLRFRGVPDSLALHHLEGSECCLIHADNPLPDGVYVNPNVRVGYNGDAYLATHPNGPWLSQWQIFSGLWKNRLLRLLTTARMKDWTVQGRVNRWRKEDKRHEERGTFCLINEMQVVVENGWAHV